MIKNLVAVAGGGALAFALAGAVSPAVALGSVHPAGVAHTKLINPAAPPTIRDSSAQFSHRGPVRIWAPPDPPVIRGSSARTSGAVHTTLTAPPDTPTVRGLTARTGDPDDGGQGALR